MHCGSIVPVDCRFCTNCGTPVAEPTRPEAPRIASSPLAAPRPAAGAPVPPAAAPTAALPVAPAVQLGGAPAAEPNITCSRCRGSNAAEMTFCQFCGARLRAENGGAPAADARQAPAAAPGAPAAAPAGDAPACLVVIAQDGTPGAEYALDGVQIDIGREEGAIVLPQDPYVSPRHARLTRRAGRFFLRDLESVNGVYVRLRAPERLKHGDLVLIGLEVLRFELVSDAERGLGPATERGTRVFGSPSLPRYARLCQRTVEGVTRDVFNICRDETVIGRESGDLVFTNDPFMSRRHAVFSREPATNTFSLRDLGSSNGTYLAIRGEQELGQGDHLRLGQHLFRLDVGRAKR
jgi:pSer/pThr/pTyr-binding forkhead associated (FHA) protein